MPAPLALSQFFLRTKGGACKNWSAAPGCRYPNWRRARSALANLDGCPCSSSAVSAAGSASLTQPLTAPCFVRWTRSLFVPPHAGEPPLSGASRQLSRGESQVYARGWRLSGGKANLKRPLLLDAFSRRSRLPFGAPAGDAPAGRRGYIYGRRAAQLRRCLRQKQPKRSRGSGLSFARAQRRPKQKQGTATVARRAGEGQAHPAEQKQKTPPSGLGTEEPFVRRKIRRECFCVPGDWTCKPVLVGTA